MAAPPHSGEKSIVSSRNEITYTFGTIREVLTWEDSHLSGFVVPFRLLSLPVDHFPDNSVAYHVNRYAAALKTPSYRSRHFSATATRKLVSRKLVASDSIRRTLARSCRY
jgi:hypothetical protein